MSRLRARLNRLIRSWRDEVVYEGDSAFTHITIRDEGGHRTLYFGLAGEEAETSVSLSDPDEPVFEYPGLMLAALPLLPQGKNIALLGLGGGFLPRLFSRHLPGYRLTVVEVDPLVAELAAKYFGFAAGPNVDLVIGDGRDFLEGAAPASFDQIWLDAFSGHYVPPRLSGADFLRLCAGKLTPGGLVAQNLHQSRPNDFRRQLAATREALGDYIGFGGTRCGNAVIVARAPGEAPGPTWERAALVGAAQEFGAVGAYDLAAEAAKLKSFPV